MRICLDCKFANWNRTSNGRLHPSGEGRCSWKKVVAFAASVPEYKKDAADRVLNSKGTWQIHRGEGDKTCPTYVRRPKEGNP